ncbi:MAG: hypothetical protein Q4D94_09405 [Bacillota bacterium]|nr:hypothetical protein [Bacillota bacterium]
MEEMKVMEFCLAASQRACEQEQERQRSMHGKADYFFKYVTLLATAFNISLPVIAKIQNVEFDTVLFGVLYYSILVVSVVSVIATLLVQRPQKVVEFPLGTEELTKAQQNVEEYNSEFERIYFEILYIDDFTSKLRENNDRTAKWLILSFITVGIMISLFGVFIGFTLFYA